MTPVVGATGVYKLKSPWFADETTAYTCHAVRTFKELYEANRDVFSLYYESQGLSRGQFELDRDHGAAIVTLISDDDVIIHVPDTYILSFPDGNVVPYRRTVLSVDLGVLPESLSLDFLLTTLRDTVVSTVGVPATVEVHVASNRSSVSIDQHRLVEAARQSAIENNTTAMALYRKQLLINQELMERNTILEQLVTDAGLIQ